MPLLSSLPVPIDGLKTQWPDVQCASGSIQNTRVMDSRDSMNKFRRWQFQQYLHATRFKFMINCEATRPSLRPILYRSGSQLLDQIKKNEFFFFLFVKSPSANG